MLGLGSSLYKAGKIGKSIIRDGLVLKHDYNAGAVEPVSSGAASFNGTSNYVDCGDIGAAKSLAFWFKPLSNISSGTAYQRLFGFNSTYQGISLGASTDKLSGEVLTVLPDGASRTGTTTTFDSSTWYHVCISWNPSSNYFDIYINGILDTDLNTGTHTLADWDSFIMGTDNGTGTHFGGYMCNVGVWSEALTQPQIKSIMHKNYAALSASEKTNLVSWWNLDSVIDSVGAATAVYDNHYAGGSKLGTELVTDGSFANGLDSWTSANVTLSGSSVILYDDSSDYVFQNISYDDGEVYAFTFEGTGDIRTRVGHSGAAATQIDVTLPATIYRLVDSDANRVQVYGSSDDSAATLTSVSVKLVNGNTGTLA